MYQARTRRSSCQTRGCQVRFICCWSRTKEWEGCLAARAHPRAFRMHKGSNSVGAVGTSSQKRDTNLRLLLLAPLWVAFSCCCRAAQVNSLTSFETDIPFDYYSMPFCKPPEGVRRAGNAANLGTVIMGVKLENSQYNFTVMVRAARLCSSAASYCTIQQLCCSRQVRHLAVGVGVAASPLLQGLCVACCRRRKS